MTKKSQELKRWSDLDDTDPYEPLDGTVRQLTAEDFRSPPVIIPRTACHKMVLQLRFIRGAQFVVGVVSAPTLVVLILFKENLQSLAIVDAEIAIRTKSLLVKPFFLFLFLLVCHKRMFPNQAA
ncbi:hypothetical protein QR680_008909 [Steinernema hermaphroditum]|uniref:Uncharacterized protein n=1 Tax=Steinernema hermaphroditum TaxID=289476 RepID=A0AA39M8I1_9BILA|nr:hypothetical protein QR680_008909 [Steinernema hermaphroditum]